MNIVKFPDNKDYLIEMLEDLLEDAKQGLITDLACVAQTTIRPDNIDLMVYTLNGSWVAFAGAYLTNQSLMDNIHYK